MGVVEVEVVVDVDEVVGVRLYRHRRLQLVQALGRDRESRRVGDRGRRKLQNPLRSQCF